MSRPQPLQNDLSEAVFDEIFVLNESILLFLFQKLSKMLRPPPLDDGDTLAIDPLLLLVTAFSLMVLLKFSHAVR